MHPSTWLVAAIVLGGCAIDDPTSEPFGPDNTWWHADTADVPAELRGTGVEPGDTAADFLLVDQYGDPVSLYQFYGRVVVLDVFAMWCLPCRDNAPSYQHLWEEYGAGGLQVIGVMQRNQNNNPATPDDVAAWIDEFGITHPVLADPLRDLEDYLDPGYPAVPLLDRDLTILQNEPHVPKHDVVPLVAP